MKREWWHGREGDLQPDLRAQVGSLLSLSSSARSVGTQDRSATDSSKTSVIIISALVVSNPDFAGLNPDLECTEATFHGAAIQHRQPDQGYCAVCAGRRTSQRNLQGIMRSGILLPKVEMNTDGDLKRRDCFCSGQTFSFLP